MADDVTKPSPSDRRSGSVDADRPAVWLAPSPRRVRDARRRSLIGIGPLLALQGLGVVRSTREFGAGYGVAIGGILVLFTLGMVIGMRRYLRTIRVYSERDALGRVDMWGRRHEVPMACVERVVVVTRFRLGGVRQDLWLFLDREGYCVQSVIGDIWDSSGLESLVARVGVPIVYTEQPMSVKKIGRRYPGAYPGWATNPWVVPCATVGLIAIVAVVLLVVGVHVAAR